MAGRRLSPEEHAVWSRVAASVRRTGRAPSVVAATPAQTQTPAPQPVELPRVKAKVSVAPILRPAANKPSKPGITLDGSWDKRIATGGAAPERTIDLHGCSVDQAHRRLLRELDMALADDVRVVLVVTGKAPKSDASRIDLPLRGIIRASIHDWVAASRHSSQIAAIRAAHPKHGGAGALYVILRRSRVGVEVHHRR